MNTLFSNFHMKDCSHKILTKKLILIRRAYFYCYKCGKLIIIKNLKMYESNTEGKLEYNPIKVINQMLSNQEFISTHKKNNLFISNIYIKNRAIFIHYIKQFCFKLNYNKNIFYTCLNLLDNYLIHEIKKEITKREIALIALGFFLVAAKFNEDDIYEPKLNQFCKIDKNIVISKNEIINTEIKVLKMMDYNIINYSTYDWIKTLNKVGYVFNGKISKLKYEQIKDRQKLLLRRIINSNILYKYNPFQIAISIIHISMDNIFYTDKISKELFDLFLTIFSKKFSDYESCYIDIKSFIFNDYHQQNKEDEKNTINVNERNKTKKIVYLLSARPNKNKLNNNNKNEKVLNVLRKKMLNDEYIKKSNIEDYISKLKTINKKQCSQDFFSSLTSFNNKHLTIDCTSNNIDNNTNMSQNKIINNYINSDINNKKNNVLYNNRISNNHLLKKSKTSLCNSPYENEEKKATIVNDYNRIKKFKNNYMNIKGSMKLIYNKNQIKNIILKKDGFINWKEGKNNTIQKNKSIKDFKENKTLEIMKRNRTNTIFPKFNK